MNTIQKLKQNLQQSLNWGSTFKQQIKKMLQQITAKTSQICEFRRQSIYLNDEINKFQSQLKGLLEEKQKAQYKKDKIQIKLDEITSRMGIYQASIKKKMQWNKQLRKKMGEMQMKIQEENKEGDWDMFDDMSESHISVKSAVSSQRQWGVKSEVTASKIDLKLQRLRKLQVQFIEQTAKCKHKQQQLQRLKKAEERLRQRLKPQNNQSISNKQNRVANRIESVQQISKQTKAYMLKLKQLERKHDETIKALQDQRKWISLYSEYTDSIVQTEKSMDALKNQVAQIDRETKMGKKTIDTICNYILNQTNS